jgi:hypothetical protein
VFVGYALQADKYAYNDFAGVDVKGKVAVCLWREPRHGKKAKTFEGEEITGFSSMRVKAEAAHEAGAIALLVAPDPVNSKDAGPLAHQLPYAIGFGGLRQALGNFQPAIPIASVSVEVAEAILGQKLLPLQQAIDRVVKPRRLSPVKGVQVTVAAATKVETREMFNVAGVLEGSDPQLKNEYVVLGCHYDHEGTDDMGAVYAGADDNASGTVALCLVARAFGIGEVKTRRSVVFAAFSAEERGLIGSEAFAKSGPVKTDDTVAMLQMDMVGRAERNRVYLLGTGKSEDMERPTGASTVPRPVCIVPQAKAV